MPPRPQSWGSCARWPRQAAIPENSHRHPRRTGALGTDYADPWQSLHAGQPGYTWDLERNPRAKEGAFAGETSRRLDRILVRSPRLKARSVRLIGDAPMPHADGLFPSDHFGVVATFVWE